MKHCFMEISRAICAPFIDKISEITREHIRDCLREVNALEYFDKYKYRHFFLE